MKAHFKFISAMVLGSALFAHAGCGTGNSTPIPPASAAVAAVCAAGQVNTVAGCSNGGICTIPGTYTQGGLVNGTCQAMTGAGVGTGVGNVSCPLPGYIYQSQYRVCCPPNLPMTPQYIQYYCQAPLTGVYGQGGSGSCPNYYNPSTGQCY